MISPDQAKAALTLAGTVVAGFLFMETRHVAASDFEQFTVQFMQSEIRALEKEMRETDDPELRERLEWDLEELLDTYCAEVDDPRRCDD